MEVVISSGCRIADAVRLGLSTGGEFAKCCRRSVGPGPVGTDAFLNEDRLADEGFEHARHADGGSHEVDVERDGAGEGVQAEGLDGLGGALFDVHPPGVALDDLAGGRASLGRGVLEDLLTADAGYRGPGSAAGLDLIQPGFGFVIDAARTIHECPEFFSTERFEDIS